MINAASGGEGRQHGEPSHFLSKLFPKAKARAKVNRTPLRPCRPTSKLLTLPTNMTHYSTQLGELGAGS